MSWFGLGALVIIFWGAVLGYLNGVKYIILVFFSLLASVFAACYCYQPFVTFAQAEWQVETRFVSWYIKKTYHAALNARGVEQFLPNLTKPVLQLLRPAEIAVPVSGGSEQLFTFWAVVTEHFLALLLFSFIFLLGAHLLLPYGRKSVNLSNNARRCGLLFGMLFGLVLSFFACQLIDLLSPVFLPLDLQADFRYSYLARLTFFFLS